LLKLGLLGLEAKQTGLAHCYLERVSREGFYPEALVGLAQIAFENKDSSQARSHLLAALDLTRSLGPEARSPFELLDSVCQGLIAMAAPLDGACAWIASLDLSSSPARVRRLKLRVQAATLADALEQVRLIYRAMFPGEELTDHQVTWEPAEPAEERLPPGIYGHHLER
jgi:hypothetical protein